MTKRKNLFVKPLLNPFFTPLPPFGWLRGDVTASLSQPLLTPKGYGKGCPPSSSFGVREKALLKLRLASSRLTKGCQSALIDWQGENCPAESKNLIRRYIILGERRISNYLWSLIILLGSCGFLLTGLSSLMYTNLPLLAFTLPATPFGSEEGGFRSATLAEHFPVAPLLLGFSELTNLSFFPQGLLMSFYGSLGFLLSFYWCFNIFWDVGGGFNEFNKKEGKIRIFRWGYPGKNRRIDLFYSLKDVESIKVEFKQGFDSQRTIYLKLKGNVSREIPLTAIGEPLTLKEIEKQASELANFLQVSLEGL
jgi:hypothetical protein